MENMWNKYLNDAELPSNKINLRIFVATFVISVDKTVADAGVIANQIRSIPNVTTVIKDTFGAEQTHGFKALYYIKFALEEYENLEIYITKVLKRSLLGIKGLTVNSFRGTEELDI